MVQFIIYSPKRVGDGWKAVSVARSIRSYANVTARRIALVMLACALACSTIVSTITLIELHEHDCAGDGCQTCHVLEIAQAAISSVTMAAHDLEHAVASQVGAAFLVVAWALMLADQTPVSERVRLLI